MTEIKELWLEDCHTEERDGVKRDYFTGGILGIFRYGRFIENLKSIYQAFLIKLKSNT